MVLPGVIDLAGQGRTLDLSLEFDYATRDPGAFLTYIAGEAGQEHLADIHYAPLPSNVAARVREAVRTLS